MIKTGQVIYDLLSASTELAALVGTNIFAIVAPENTPMPFVVISRSFENQNTKDGLATSRSAVTLSCVGSEYGDTISVADACYEALKIEARLDTGIEKYDPIGAYVQVLTFSYWGI